MKRALEILGAGFARGQKRSGVDRALTRLLALGLADHLPVGTRVARLDDDRRRTSQPGRYLGRLARHLGERALARGSACLPLVIGGDHTIACATMTATLRRYPHSGLLLFDAHADFNNVDTSPSGNLHGMPVHGLVYGSRTFGGLPDFDWLGEGRLRPERIAILGVRDVDPAEQVLLDSAGILRVDMTEVDRGGMASAVNRCIDHLGRDRPLHVSVDLDSLDPSVFPATGVPVPGGMTFDQLMDGVRIALQQADVCAVDLVEYNPELDDEEANCGRLVLTLIDGLVAALL